MRLSAKCECREWEGCESRVSRERIELLYRIVKCIDISKHITTQLASHDTEGESSCLLDAVRWRAVLPHYFSCLRENRQVVTQHEEGMHLSVQNNKPFVEQNH